MPSLLWGCSGSMAAEDGWLGEVGTSPVGAATPSWLVIDVGLALVMFTGIRDNVIFLFNSGEAVDMVEERRQGRGSVFIEYDLLFL